MKECQGQPRGPYRGSRHKPEWRPACMRPKECFFFFLLFASIDFHCYVWICMCTLEVRKRMLDPWRVVMSSSNMDAGTKAGPYKSSKSS